MLAPEEHIEDLPEPSAELVLVRVMICSLARTLGPKKAEAFLTDMAKTLGSEEAVTQLLPLRPKEQRAAVNRARRGAVAWFRQMVPAFLQAKAGR